MALLARTLGAATAAFGAATALRPELVTVPAGLTDQNGATDRRTRVLVSLIGCRDVAVGTAMVAAPRGPALRWLVAARAVSDAGDAVLLGSRLPHPAARVVSVAAAGGWAALCAYSARSAREPNSR